MGFLMADKYQNRCFYCFNDFGSSHYRTTCSDRCRKRLTAWANWEKRTTEQVLGGDINKPFPKIAPYPGKSGLEDDIAPYFVHGPVDVAELELSYA